MEVSAYHCIGPRVHMSLPIFFPSNPDIFNLPTCWNDLFPLFCSVTACEKQDYSTCIRKFRAFWSERVAETFTVLRFMALSRTISHTPFASLTCRHLDRPLLFLNFIYLYFFNNCIVPLGFLPWEIQVAFPTAVTESCYPTCGACWVF